jgi:hypothetical protein
MTPRSWIRTLFARTPRTVRTDPARHQPRLEALEDRLAPATLTVNTVADNTGADASLTLREAIALVSNAGNAPAALGRALTTGESAQINTTQPFGTNDRIGFASGLTGTITLGGTQLPTLTTNLAIAGPGADLLTISGNNASGIFRMITSAARNYTLSGLTLANGNAVFGAGVRCDSGGGSTLNIQDCVFTGNQVSATGGALAVNGGAALNGAPAATVNISNTTFSNNHAGNAGAAQFFNVTARLVNCTISGNTASSAWGGLEVEANGTGNFSDATLMNCTIANNSGSQASGLRVLGAGGQATARYVNTIFANAGSGSPNVATGGGASVTSQGHNIADDGSGNLTGSGDQPNTNPRLGSLQNNGGHTPTMALLPGSPAIDAGTGTGAPSADQRGVSWVGAADIGAFESQGFTLSITGGDNQRAIVNTAFAAPLAVQVTSAHGEPVQGGVVTFTAPAGGASAAFPGGSTATLGADGKASLAVTANGTAGSYSVSAAASSSSSATFSLTNLPAIALTPVTLPDGTYGSAYSQPLTAAGGAGAPYTFAVTAGALPGGLSLDPSGTLAGTPTAAGAFTFTVQATDGGSFTGSQSYTLTIDKATPTVTWANPAAIVYGTALGATQLNATADVPGTFAYTPAAGTVPSAGPHTLSVTFTPTDAADYTSATASVPLTVLTADQRFVRALYRQALGRDGSLAELDIWVAWLNGPDGSRAEVAARIENSLEARTRLVSSWYRAYLGRDAQGGEEQGWVSWLQAGGREEDVMAAILASPEFQGRAPTLVSAGGANERIVRALYGLPSGSPATAGGTGNLPALGGAGVARSFLASAEYRLDAVGSDYGALLHRPAEPAGLDAWSSSELDLFFVRVGIESSDEFYAGG